MSRKPSPLRKIAEILDESPPTMISMAEGLPNRGREDQRKFFSAWKVLKVCSKKYIKNYLFFRNDLFHHEQCTNITMILRTCGHFGHFLPCFSLHPQSL